MSEEEQLREMMAASIPEPPAAPERAVQARRYAAASARRRTTGVVVGAAAVAAVVLVPFAIGGGGGGPRPGPADPSTPAAATEFACPPKPEQGETPPPVTGDHPLPKGAVAVRLCDSGGLLAQPPLDALTTKVDEVIAAANALPARKPCDAAPWDAGPTWDLAFRYPDGRTQTVRGASHGCGGVAFGDGITYGGRTDANRPLWRFQRLLLEQRESAPAPSVDLPELSCRPRHDLTMMPREKPLTAERAVLCWKFETRSKQPTEHAVIEPDDLAVLLTDFNSAPPSDRRPTDAECNDPDRPDLHIAASNRWGDLLRLDTYCGGFDLGSGYWWPNAESQAILDRLVGSQPREIAAPNARTRPEQVVAIWTDLHNGDERDRAQALWVDPSTAPTGAVELKTGETKQFEPEAGTPAAAYDEVVQVDANGRVAPGDHDEIVFTLVRNGPDETWRILSLD